MNHMTPAVQTADEIWGIQTCCGDPVSIRHKFQMIGFIQENVYAVVTAETTKFKGMGMVPKAQPFFAQHFSCAVQNFGELVISLLAATQCLGNRIHHDKIHSQFMRIANEFFRVFQQSINVCIYFKRFKVVGGKQLFEFAGRHTLRDAMIQAGVPNFPKFFQCFSKLLFVLHVVSDRISLYTKSVHNVDPFVSINLVSLFRFGSLTKRFRPYRFRRQGYVRFCRSGRCAPEACTEYESAAYRRNTEYRGR